MQDQGLKIEENVYGCVLIKLPAWLVIIWVQLQK